MKIHRKDLDNSLRNFYVVTRNGRRIEDTNYSTEDAAQARAGALLAMVKEWDPASRNSVSIICTAKPRKIY